MTPAAIIDANVAMKWVLPETNRPAAMSLLRRHLTGDLQLIAPDLLMAEAASALSKRCRRGMITASQAEEAYDLLLEYKVALIASDQLLSPALRIALRHHISLWDAVYVALAVREQCRLITADQRFIRAARRIYETVELLETAAASGHF